MKFSFINLNASLTLLIGAETTTPSNADTFSLRTILLSPYIKSLIFILNVSNPIEEISRISSSSLFETKNENVPSSVDVTPIFF